MSASLAFWSLKNFSHWKFTTSFSVCDKGTGIILCTWKGGVISERVTGQKSSDY